MQFQQDGNDDVQNRSDLETLTITRAASLPFILNLFTPSPNEIFMRLRGLKIIIDLFYNNMHYPYAHVIVVCV